MILIKLIIVTNSDFILAFMPFIIAKNAYAIFILVLRKPRHFIGRIESCVKPKQSTSPKDIQTHHPLV